MASGRASSRNDHDPAVALRAVLVSGGEPSYYYRDETVEMTRVVMVQGQVNLLCDTMIITAPTAVYAPTRNWPNTP